MLPVSKHPHHASMATRKTIAQRNTAGSIVKPSELIDIDEMVPLQLVDRRIFNLLLANAWDADRPRRRALHTEA